MTPGTLPKCKPSAMTCRATLTSQNRRQRRSPVDDAEDCLPVIFLRWEQKPHPLLYLTLTAGAVSGR